MKNAETRIVHRNAVAEDSGDSAHQLLVTIYGAHIGRKYDLDSDQGEVVLGRDVGAGLHVDDDSVSRAHCRLIRADGGWQIEDLGSTNGTYVAGEPVQMATLRDGDLIKVGSTIFKYLSASNVEAAYHEEIYRMAIFDGLTQIHNRRYFEEFTEREIARSRRHNRQLSLLIFDVDHFKSINDQFGHLSGDYALRKLAATVRARIRREELFARYAGDEFVVVLPETTPNEAQKFGEIIRELVDETRFVFEGQELPVTISMGVGGVTDGTHTPAQLVATADAALYRAKEHGRNRVSL
jgi:diguanylate cyclase (GGDEF)-like protein